MHEIRRLYILRQRCRTECRHRRAEIGDVLLVHSFSDSNDVWCHQIPALVEALLTLLFMGEIK